MSEAYEVGITLALQDGVSAGIQLIQRDLALLDRAIAATSQSLTALGGKAGGPKTAPALPALAGSVANELNNTAKFVPSSMNDTTATVLDTDSASASPAVAPAQASPPGSPTRPISKQAADVGLAGPADSGLAQRPAAPAGTTAIANAPTATTQATATSRASEAATPNEQAEAALRPQTSVAPVETTQVFFPTKPDRRIGPVLPRQLSPGVTDDPGAVAAPVPARREPPTATVSAARSAAPLEKVNKLDSRAAAKQSPEFDAANSSSSRVNPSAPQVRSSSMATLAPSTGQPPRRGPAPSPSPRYSPTSIAPEPQEQTARLPGSEPKRDGGQQALGGAAAPAPAAAQAITMQGDIIIDGMRLGRWLTNAMARQASRPPSGPVAPDPRQTPLWSGQAQGF